MEETNEKYFSITMNVKVAILRSDGSNCDEEAFFAFNLAGASTEMVHVNTLVDRKNSLDRYHILVIPGGFAYGDDILSGKILAIELLHRLGKDVNRFSQDGKLILGICNGFQVLVRMGLLPGGGGPAEEATLIFNDSSHFECRWIRLRVEDSVSVFTRGMEGSVIELPVAHGEGKFVTKNAQTLKKIEQKKIIALRYCHPGGMVATDYPANPNGSLNSIAGISNAAGTIFGLMPHPERFVKFSQHPNWTRYRPGRKIAEGLPIFQNAVAYARKHL